ncbi:MAG: toll/interleukin-1 receptor domain-containing protein [Acidobacteria bacterium]|nr:toll/interleukin-1 receptor domain-containing protein [Acidobacteriota bacterium]
MAKADHPRKKLVLIYSHKDRDFLEKSRFIDFLRAVATDEGLDLWWDEKLSHPLWDKEIKSRLEEAFVVVCLVSQPFLNSDYVREVEAKRSYHRLIKEEICLVPVMYQPCLWESHEWLKQVNHIPKDGYIFGRSNQSHIFLEVAQYIKKCLGRSSLFRKPRALYTLRNIPDENLLANQRALLQRDSVERSDRYVPDRRLQRNICTAAKPLLRKNKGRPLSKAQLEDLDRRFLARGKRKPDAMKVRWVFRAHGLHPQGRVRA